MRHALSRALTSYDTALRRRPLRVKMLSSAVIVGCSDSLVQLSERHIGSSSEPHDFWRTFLIGGAYGGLTFAPVLHLVTTTWARILPSTSVAALALKSVIDMTTSFPFNLSAMIGLQVIARGKVLDAEVLQRDIPAAVKQNLWPSLQVGWCVWTPVGFLNYWLVPLRYRVLSLNTVSLGWNFFMVWRFTAPVDENGSPRE